MPKSRSATRPRPAITEAKLRRLIRDELARQHLVNEGILDAIKAPFKKLGEKAKKTVASKAEEILGKLKGAMGDVKGIEDQKKFFKVLEGEEGGMSLKDIVSSNPDYASLQKEAEVIKGIDLSSQKPGASNESISYEDLRTSLILIEENYLQRQERLSREIINESIIVAVAGTWWAAVKTVVAACGLIGFAAESGSKICKFVGLEKAADAFKKIHHFVEHVEELFLDKVAFPKPVQYAAYRAMWAIKSGVSKAKGKEASGDALDMKAFNSAEGKEEREATLKALHTAVMIVLVFQAFSHVIESITEFFHAASQSAGESIHAGTHAGEKLAHVGVEAKNLAKAGKAAAAASEEMAAARSV
jgi:hypothetical protein